jgi:predicted dehydrogenase
MNHLIIGGGSIGKRHIRNLQLIQEKNIFCLRRKLEAEFDAENKCTSILRENILDFGQYDSIYICTPTYLHFDNLKDIIDNTSKPVFIFMEKPFLFKESEYKYLLKKSNFSLFMGFMLRFHPSIIFIKKCIEEGLLGNIYHCRFEFGSYLPSWHPEEDYKNSYASNKRMGGGVINTICHELDLLIHFFGFPTEAHSLHTNSETLGIDSEDIAELTFKFSWGLSSIHLNYLDKVYHRKIELRGTNGNICWNWNENKVHLTDTMNQSRIIQETSNFETNQLYLDELRFFNDLVKNKNKENPYHFGDVFKFSELLSALSINH